MQNDFQKFLSFIKLTGDFRLVERFVWVHGRSNPENDAEHSFQVAIIAWYLIASGVIKEELNMEKVFKYALVHDLVEIYAGDTPSYDSELAKTKKERELAAQQKLCENFGEFEDMHTHIESYERKEDPESLFVHAIDKMLPSLNLIMNDTSDWKNKGITLKDATDFVERSNRYKPLTKFRESLLDYLQEHREKLFA